MDSPKSGMHMLYRDNGKENGSYYNGLYRVYWDYIGLVRDNGKENGSYYRVRAAPPSPLPSGTSFALTMSSDCARSPVHVGPASGCLAIHWNCAKLSVGRECTGGCIAWLSSGQRSIVMLPVSVRNPFIAVNLVRVTFLDFFYC